MKKIILIIIILGASIVSKAQEYPTMIYVEGGTFIMGETCQPSRDENKQPQTRIVLKSFKIAQTEITQGQWRTYCKEANKYFQFVADDSNDDCPAYNLSWYSAIEYCNWLSKRTGKTYRLPTEAEWEYSARGGKKSKGFKYSGGNDLNTVGWYNTNSNTNPNPHALKKNSVHKVGLKKPNELGIFDMSGNVSEWCYYHCNSQFESNKISRGGSYLSNENACSVNWRTNEGLDSYCGFRIVEVLYN